MGGDPNPPKGGLVVKATIDSVSGKLVTFELDEADDAAYFKERIDNAVIISVSDASRRD
jgi:hypothetical protein